MRKILYYALACCVALFASSVNIYADDDDSDSFGARLSGEVDYKIMKGMHVYASEELRFFGGSDFIDRSYSELGFSYKINDHLKVAVSYTAIAVNKKEVIMPDNEEITLQWTEWRHRVSADLTASVKVGQWRFSLRERIQGTYKMRELNNYQQPQMGWVLRSRLKVAYKFRSVPFEPYAYFEPRLLLNGAKWSEESLGKNYENASFLGHKDVYFNRYRCAAGLEWKLNKRNSLDFYMLYDHLYDKEIDARKEGSIKGVVLKAPIHGISSDRISVGVAYKYSF